MKKIFGAVLLITFISVTPAFSQDEKNYDAVYLSVVKEYTLKADGSMEYHYSKDQKLLTYRAINAFYGETFIVYHPQFQELEVSNSSTTMADGKLVKAPSNAFNEVLPSAAANAPAFNMLREMVVTHTGLERGAVIHLDYAIRSAKGFYPALAANEVLAEIEPVRSLTIRVKVPTGQKLVYRTINIKKEPVKTEEIGFTVYTWKFANVPPVSAEEHQPGGSEIQPRLVFTTDTDAAAAWNRFVSQPAFGLTSSESMKNEVDGLVAGNNAKDLLALKIQEKVVNEVNLTPVPMRFTGFSLRTPEEVWSGNYGNLPEKSLLLAALLRNAGIDAVPCAVFRGTVYNEKIADLYAIEDVIVRATVPDGKVMWLSASNLNNQDLSVTLPGRVFVPLVNGGNTQAVTTQAVPGMALLTGNIYINEKNEMTGSVTATMTGPANPQYGLLRDEGKAKQWIAGIGSKEIKEVQLSQPGSDASKFTFQVQKDNILKKDTALRTFTLPYLSSGIESWGLKQLPSYRNSPLENSFPLTETLELTLTVPDNLMLLSPVSDDNFSNAAGSYRYELKKEAGKIVINKSITVKNRITGPKDYAALKSLMDSWNAQQQREVVFVAK